MNTKTTKNTIYESVPENSRETVDIFPEPVYVTFIMLKLAVLNSMKYSFDL